MTLEYTVNVDTGGTFTDGFFSDGQRVWTAKVETTPHDLTVCFIECLEAGARAVGLSLPELLDRAQAVRYATTWGTNTLIQKSGPRLGLIVTEGQVEGLYGAERLGAILDRSMVVGLAEQMERDGTSRQEPEPEAVRTAVETLLDRGARGIVVSLQHAAANPAHELRVRQIVDALYPRHYIGSVTLWLSHEVSDRPGDADRTATALLNAYFHPALAHFLYRAEDQLRDRGYRRPLLVVHGSGGVARVAKTRAIQTYNSGPAAGVYGSTRIASELYHLPHVVSMDIGGTSTDIAMIAGQQVKRNPSPSVEGIRLQLPLVDIVSIGSGGGSIARLDRNEVRVGPESAGAVPGPACYNRGGARPTATDAEVVLGYINPGRFLGGRRQLRPERAEQALRAYLCGDGRSVIEAALAVRQGLQADIAREVGKRLVEAAAKPANTALFAYGGAGANYCCAIADRLGIPKVFVFPFGAVFSAAGIAGMDVMHLYEKGFDLPLRSPELTERVEAPLRRLWDRAARDVRGEGYGWTEAAREAVLYVRQNGSQSEHRRQLGADAPAAEELVAALRSAQGHEGARLTGLELTVTCPTPRFGFRTAQSATGVAKPAAERRVHWDAQGTSTPIYDLADLKPGQLVRGPAIVEADDMSCVVETGWQMAIDEYSHGILERR